MIRSSFLILFLFQAIVINAQSVTKPYKYSPGDDTYFSENGFNSIDYKWDNQEINLHLTQALKHKKRGNLYIAGGLSLVGIGSMTALMGTLFQIQEEENSSEFSTPIVVGTSLAALGGCVVIIGRKAQKRKSRYHIQKAITIRGR